MWMKATSMLSKNHIIGSMKKSVVIKYALLNAVLLESVFEELREIIAVNLVVVVDCSAGLRKCVSGRICEPEVQGNRAFAEQIVAKIEC